VRPALQFESLLETMFVPPNGKTNRKGMPNPLRLAVIAHAHFDTVRLPPLAWLQKAGLAIGAPLGRAWVIAHLRAGSRLLRPSGLMRKSTSTSCCWCWR
jgi:hypothetical protein